MYAAVAETQRHSGSKRDVICNQSGGKLGRRLAHLIFTPLTKGRIVIRFFSAQREKELEESLIKTCFLAYFNATIINLLRMTQAQKSAWEVVRSVSRWFSSSQGELCEAAGAEGTQ